METGIIFWTHGESLCIERGAEVVEITKGDRQYGIEVAIKDWPEFAAAVTALLARRAAIAAEVQDEVQR